MENKKGQKLVLSLSLAIMSMSPLTASAATSPYMSGDSKAMQQTENVLKGIVTDQAGEPLIGVSISVKGTSSGTVTDINGKYSLRVSPGSTLVFTYIGYTPREVRVRGGKDINVTLS